MPQPKHTEPFPLSLCCSNACVWTYHQRGFVSDVAVSPEGQRVMSGGAEDSTPQFSGAEYLKASQTCREGGGSLPCNNKWNVLGALEFLSGKNFSEMLLPTGTVLGRCKAADSGVSAAARLPALAHRAAVGPCQAAPPALTRLKVLRGKLPWKRRPRLCLIRAARRLC